MFRSVNRALKQASYLRLRCNGLSIAIAIVIVIVIFIVGFTIAARAQSIIDVRVPVEDAVSSPALCETSTIRDSVKVDKAVISGVELMYETPPGSERFLEIGRITIRLQYEEVLS